MTTPIWMLLGFATWTIGLLAFTIGIYRWALIFAGKAPINRLAAVVIKSLRILVPSRPRHGGGVIL